MQGCSHWSSRGANRAPSALSSPWTTKRAALDRSAMGVMPPLPIIRCMRMPVLVWRRAEWPACSLLPLPWGNLSLFHELCTPGASCASQERWLMALARFLTALRAGPPLSWGVTSGGPPGGRSFSKDGTRADSAKGVCRLVGGVYYAGNLISD